jgi:Iron-sulfur cluster assembly accessory protein
MATIERELKTISFVPQPLVNVHESAAQRLSAMMQEKQLENYALRVFVSGGGCSGLQYGMTFDNEVREDDADYVVNGLRVLVDPVSARYLRGASIEYSEELLGGGFKIDNPNAISACGCGHSFRAREDGDEGDEESYGGACGSCGCH